MGTDIHPAVEVRRNGVWRYRRPTEPCRWYFETWDIMDAARVNANIAKMRAEGKDHGMKDVVVGERRHPWDRCKTRLPECFTNRNYAKFALLGDVRNGYGFAGVKTFVPLQAISKNRGRPNDISKEAEAKLSNEHSDGWVTLQELLEYDYTKPLGETGVITERQFLDAIYHRKDPESWSGGVSGKDIVVLSPENWINLFASRDTFGVKIDGQYDPTKTYYIQYGWEVPLATAVPDVLEMIEYLKPLVPKGGTPDDVRVVFDFDS